MNAVAVLVDAVNELAATGRLSDDTRRAMSDAVQAANYGHPGFPETILTWRQDDEPEPR